MRKTFSTTADHIIRWLPLVAGVGLSLLLLAHVPMKEADFNDAALGAGTVSVYPAVNGRKIHCNSLDNATDCIAGWKERGRRSLVLWLGNSQLHAINQRKPGEVPGSALLQDLLWRNNNMDLLTFSQPNANLQEHLVLFSWLLDRITPKVLVLPVVFDDLRETGLRSRIQIAINDTSVAARIGQSAVGQTIMSQARQAQSSSNSVSSNNKDKDSAALMDTFQERTESAINDGLEHLIPAWEKRGKMRSALLLQLFFLRNWLLGITAQTRRPLIPGRRLINMNALEALLHTTKNTRMKTIVYIVPLRNDVQIPYVQKEYEAFKKDTERLAQNQEAIFVDFEDFVPAQYWGSKDATNLSGGQELDFMHFQAEGHRLLAEALHREIARIIGVHP